MMSSMLSFEEIRAIDEEPCQRDAQGYVIPPEGLSEDDIHLIGQALNAYWLQIHANRKDFETIGVQTSSLKEALKSILRLRHRLGVDDTL